MRISPAEIFSRLAAAGRADQDHELAIGNLNIHTLDDRVRAE
jgi:hypothetical protein